jgi:hypothetical protein
MKLYVIDLFTNFNTVYHTNDMEYEQPTIIILLTPFKIQTIRIGKHGPLDLSEGSHSVKEE